MLLLTGLLTLALAQDAPPAPETPSPDASASDAPAALPTPKELAPYQKAFPGRVTPDVPHYDLEVLYFQDRDVEGLTLTQKRLEATPDDVDLYWHALRFMYEIGEAIPRDNATIDKEAHYKTMAEYAEKGLELDPDNPHLLFGKGVALGRLGTTRGVLASLFMAKDVEGSWKAALDTGFSYAAIGDAEYIPCDVHQALAIYYRLVPDWWIVQVIAGTRGSIEKSVDHARKATACAPAPLIRSTKEQGVSEICFGQRNKDPVMVETGLATLKSARALPPRGSTDTIDLAHIEMLIADPDLACEYSRDGQQDLDKEKLDQ